MIVSTANPKTVSTNPRNMALCNNCQNLLPNVVLVERESREKGLSNYEKHAWHSWRRILHHDSLTTLLDAATFCRLCKLFKNQFHQRNLDWLRYKHPSLYGTLKQSAVRVKITYCGTKGTWMTPSLSIQEDESFTRVFKDQTGHSFNGVIWSQSHLVATMKSNGALLDRPAWNIRRANDFDERLSVVRGWLEACLSDQNPWEDCSKKGPPVEPVEPPILPKRFIDVGSAQSQTARLVCRSGQKAFYTTLSYCRGGKLELTARGNTIGSLLSGFAISSLPKTYQDAIAVTRALGIRYIWIDALCIMQDDQTDVQEEIVDMADIYRNSWLTIAATGSSNADGGCLHSLTAPLETTSDGTGVESPNACRVWIRESPRFKQTVTDAVLNTRAWTLQENILSPRILYCAEDQLYWQCGHRVKSEDGLIDEKDPASAPCFVPHESQLQDLPASFSHVSVWSLDRLPLQDSLIRTLRPPFDKWYRIVNNFTSRTLTYPEDRLRALAGIIGLMDRFDSGNKNLVGLWLRDLHVGLAWKFDGETENRDYPQIGLPSWSWASFNGPIAYEDYSVHTDRSDWHPEFAVLQYSIEWSGQPVSSRVLKADLKLKARVRPLYITQKSDGLAIHIDQESCERPDKAFIATSSTERGIKIELDRNLELSVTTIYAMYLFHDGPVGYYRDNRLVLGSFHFLLLAPADGEDEKFFRVGVGHASPGLGLRLFEGLDERELTLI